MLSRLAARSGRSASSFEGRALVLLAVVVVAALGAAPANAFWNGFGETGKAEGSAQAGSLAQAKTPTVNKIASAAVSLSWGANEGLAPDGYVVTRTEVGPGGASTPAANGCAGVVATTSCTETGVAAGQWRYTITPVLGANWKGIESPASAAVSTAPGTVNLSATLFGGTGPDKLPATVTGNVSGFTPNEGVTYTLDSGPAALPLVGLPARVGQEGSAAITSLAIPAGVSDGNHTVRVLGAQGSEATLPIIVDNAAPSGGSVDATGLGGTGARYSTTRSLTLALNKGTDPLTGLALTGNQISRATAPLTSDGSGEGVCGTFGNFTLVAADPATPLADSVSTDQACYRYHYVVADRVGNKVTYQSPDIKVDTLAPPAPTLAFSGLSSAFWSGAGTTVFYKPTAPSGSFKVTAESSDTTAGIGGFAFPTLATGWSGAPAGANAETYSWSAANPSAPGTKTITVTNRAGASAGTGFTLTADATGPSGGAISYANGSISTTSTAVTLTNGTDAGSGLNAASGILQRASAPIASGACGSFGAFAQVALDPGPTFSDTGLEDSKCYQYRYLVSDNLGNQTTYTSASVVKVQLAPTNTGLPTISGTARENATLTAGNGSWNGTGLAFTYQWSRCDTAGNNCTDIAGATASQHPVVGADVGKTLRVAATATNGGGSATASSDKSAVVVFATPINTVLPQIVNSPVVNSTLEVSTGTWTGGGIGFTFAWLRCDASGNACVPIAIPSRQTYTLEALDVGHTIRVDVTASSSGGSTTVRTAPTLEVSAEAPINLTLPSISGPTIQESALSASQGTWSSPGGTAGLTFKFQWLRCDTTGANCENVGAQAATYVLVAGDVGHRMKVVVTAENSSGATQATSVQTAVVVFKAPVNTSLPSFTGEAEVSKTLTAGEGVWTGGGIAFSYHWRRCDVNGNNCSNIAGAAAEAKTYVPTDEDASVHTLRVAVTATNSGGSATALSPATEVIRRVAPVNAALPEVTGQATQGQSLATSNGTWTGTGITFKYHWLRCDSGGANCAKIEGVAAENATYLATAADVGSKLRAEVSAVNTGHSVPAISAPTSVVTVAKPVNTVPPTVPGTPKENVAVTATNGTWTGTGIVFTYQWQRCEGSGSCVTIAAATAQSYTPVSADVGKNLRVIVTATNGGGSATATSNPSATVVFAPPVSTGKPVISGTPKVGTELTASTGTWTGSGLSFTYQWRSCDSAGNNCTVISGATAESYTPVAADVSHKMKVEVTATNSGGSVKEASLPTATTVVP